MLTVKITPAGAGGTRHERTCALTYVATHLIFMFLGEGRHEESSLGLIIHKIVSFALSLGVLKFILI